MINNMPSLINPDQLLELTILVEKVTLSEATLNYIWTLLDFTRNNKDVHPLSPRCGLDIVRAAKARAFMMGRDYVLPDDVKWIFPFVAGHRLSSSGIKQEQQLALEIINANPVV